MKAMQAMLEGIGGANGFDPSKVLQGIVAKLGDATSSTTKAE